MNTKICSRCNKEKSIELFIINKQCKNERANICKECQNQYSKIWKRNNSERLAKRRREIYAETNGEIVKKRQQKRKSLYPLRCRCQILRTGMKHRAKIKNIIFDNSLFTVKYLMNKLEKNPHCECCGKKLDLEFKKQKIFNNDSPSMDRVNSKIGYTKENTAILCWCCNKHKQDSTAAELRQIANFMDYWENKV